MTGVIVVPMNYSGLRVNTWGDLFQALGILIAIMVVIFFFVSMWIEERTLSQQIKMFWQGCKEWAYRLTH